MRRTAAPLARTVALTLAGLVLVTGCSRNSTQDDDESQGDQSSAATSASDLPTELEAQPEPSQGAPATDTPSATTVTASPDADQTTDLAAQLGAIAPGLADDRDAAVVAASNLCRQIAQGQDDTSLVSTAGIEFRATGAPELTDDQSRAVVEAVRDSFCHE